MTEIASFYELDEKYFPFTVEFINTDTNEIIYTKTILSKEQTIEIPVWSIPFGKLAGRVVFSDGYVSEFYKERRNVKDV